MGIKVLFSGDFAFSQKPNNKTLLSNDFKSIIKEHDIFCCNLEGAITTKADKPIKKVGPIIQNNSIAVKDLINSGCNMFCLANNHIFDYGLSGLNNTISFLDNSNVIHIGAGNNKKQIYSPYIYENDNIKIGFINVAENGFGASIDLPFGYSYAFDSKIENIIKSTKEITDFVVLISHIGAELWDVPLPEVKDLYKRFLDCGADVIIGHHPHVPQGWEVYENGIVFYSLGNFIFDKGKGIQNKSSFSVSIEFNKNQKIKYNIVPTEFDNYSLKINRTDYSYLAELITNKELYNDVLEKQLKKAYEHYKAAYYKVVSHDRGSLKELIKGFIKRYIFRQKFQNIWLYHNINIETHLWICKRVSRMIIENEIAKELNMILTSGRNDNAD